MLALQGAQPTVQEALDLHFILSQSDTDLRQPVGLEEQLMADERLGSAVGMSMLQLLQVTYLMPFPAAHHLILESLRACHLCHM